MKIKRMCIICGDIIEYYQEKDVKEVCNDCEAVRVVEREYDNCVNTTGGVGGVK